MSARDSQISQRCGHNRNGLGNGLERVVLVGQNCRNLVTRGDLAQGVLGLSDNRARQSTRHTARDRQVHRLGRIVPRTLDKGRVEVEITEVRQVDKIVRALIGESH